MKALDFFYDGIILSDLGFVLCNFDGGGTDTIASPEITFNTISTQRGASHHITSVEFEDCLTATMQICKNLCNDSNMEIDLETQRDIMRWLCRKEYHKFKIIDDAGEYTGVYFEGSFNVSKIEIDGRLYGFELELITNHPYGIAEPITLNIDAEAGELVSIYNKSDDEGYIYPNMEITIVESGDLEIYNAFEDRTMLIKNCVKDEIITIEYPMISSSLQSHNNTIMNDFNWQFFRLASTFKDRLNKVTVSLPCNIKMTYSPTVKVWI